MPELNSEAIVKTYSHDIDRRVTEFQDEVAELILQAVDQSVRVSNIYRTTHSADVWFSGLMATTSVLERVQPSATTMSTCDVNHALKMAATELFEACD